jgi:lipid-A-disaccharide synthase
MLDNMIEVAGSFKEYQFVFAGTTNLPKQSYDRVLKHNMKVVFNQTYELMSYAKAGIIKSGTSTLESALFNLPQVVCYKGGALSFAIGKQLVNIKYISLPNLIMDKPIVKELIQNDFTVKNIAAELHQLLYNQSYRENILTEYSNLVIHLGGAGASSRIAKYIVADLTPTS